MSELAKQAMIAKARQDIHVIYTNPSAIDEDVWGVLETLFNDAYDLGRDINRKGV
jgi:hypothetical protein